MHDHGECNHGGKRFYYIVMDFKNANLSELMKRNVDGVLSHKSTLMATIQMIRLMKSMHEVGYIHRDIKPDNFVIGISEITRRMLFVLDLGLAEKFRD